MGYLTAVISTVAGNRVELSPGMQTDEHTPEEIGAAFDTALTALAQVGIYPTRIERADADTDAEAPPYDITRARRAERNAIAGELMTLAERNQERERYAVAAALAIASNMVRRGGQ
jgi:hypothetical protein